MTMTALDAWRRAALAAHRDLAILATAARETADPDLTDPADAPAAWADLGDALAAARDHAADAVAAARAADGGG
jgi:hypothetical protein